MTKINTAIIDKVKAALITDLQKAAVDGLVKDLHQEVNRIESMTPLTQNHYGEYLGLATNQLAVILLIAVGANRQGVVDAARINGIAV